MSTIKVPGEDIYINHPKDMRFEKQAHTILFYNSTDWLVGLTFDLNNNFSGTIADVLPVLSQNFVNDSATSSNGNLYGSDITESSSKQTKVNGFDSINFTGVTVNDGKWDCHTYGYTFVINDIPCAVIGIVSTQAQEEAMIEQLDKAVDEIAATIRTAE